VSLKPSCVDQACSASDSVYETTETTRPASPQRPGHRARGDATKWRRAEIGTRDRASTI
jgi:hypothetical protein